MPSGKREVGDFGRELAAEVRAAAAREGLRPGELADKAGLSPSTLSKLLNGTSTFDVEQLRKVGNALGIEAWELSRRADYALAAKEGRVQRPDLGSQDTDEPA